MLLRLLDIFSKESALIYDLWAERQMRILRERGGRKDKKMLSCLLDMFSKESALIYDLWAEMRQMRRNLERRRGGRSRKDAQLDCPSLSSLNNLHFRLFQLDEAPPRAGASFILPL
mgnify:CR=1 FL=1